MKQSTDEIRLFEDVVTIILDESIGSSLLYRKFKYQTSELQLFLQHVPVLYWYPLEIIGRNIKYDIIDACLFKSVMRNNFHDYSNMDMINNINDEIDDEEIMETSKQKLKRLLESLFDDELFILQELKKCQQGNYPMQYASDRLKDDEQFMLKAVKINGRSLAFASERLRNNEQLILQASMQKYYEDDQQSSEIDNDTIEDGEEEKEAELEAAIKYGRMIDDEQIALEVVKKNGCSLEYISDRLKDNEEIALAAVKENGNALDLVSERLKDDEQIVFQSIKESGNALFYASKRLRDNEEVVLEAVKQNGHALAYTFNRLKDNEIIVLEAVKQNSAALEFASNRLKDDEQIVLEAVKQTSSATEYASNRLKDNELFILQAVRYNGYALAYASNRLKDNEIIVLEAVKQNVDSLFHASQRLRNDFNFAKEIFKCCTSLNIFEHFGEELRNIEFIYYFIENYQLRFHELIRDSQQKYNFEFN